jgi:hypothetical protein
MMMIGPFAVVVVGSRVEVAAVAPHGWLWIRR